MLIWLLFRSEGYKRVILESPPGDGFSPTQERFVDPSTSEAVEVWYDPVKGERAYIRTAEFRTMLR